MALLSFSVSFFVKSQFFDNFPQNDDEDDEEEDNDEENDGFFVPHGYLSDDEGLSDEDGEKKEEHVDIRVGFSLLQF